MRSREELERADKAKVDAWERFKTYRPSATLQKFHLAGRDIVRGVVEKGTGKKLVEPRNYVRCVLGPVGCLPCDTEVMTERGWVRIDTWDGEAILQWDGATGVSHFAVPEAYHVYDCGEFIRFDSPLDFCMTVSAEHTVALYDADGRFLTARASDLMGHTDKYFVPRLLACDNPADAPTPFSLKGTKCSRVPSEDGKKYCFTTGTGFFVVRQRGAIFVTGNSGKSVACCMEIMFRAMEQPPGPDGVRRSRIAMVRDTFKNLKDTTLQTWLSWFPEGSISKVSWSPPIEVEVAFPMADGTRVKLDIKCLGLEGGEKSMEDLKSLELTGAWVNECQAIRLPIINQLIQRVGRYPSGADNPEKKSVFYVIMDTNPPNIGNWYEQLAEHKRPEGWTFFRQPPALLWEEKESGEIAYEPNVGQRAGVPPAENIEHLGEGFMYYLKNLGSQSDEFTKVFICCEYGVTSGGRPVYPGYKDSVHYREEGFEYRRGFPLILGFDYGTTPACVICQLSDRGQLRVLEEVVGDNTFMTEFFEQQLRPVLVNTYGWGGGVPLFAVGDPSGDFRKDTDGTTAALVLRERGIPVVPCTTNGIAARVESVRMLMSRYTDGRTPDLMMSGKCPILREGFLGNYRFAEVRGMNSGRLRDVPEKNEYSHVHDALQYACHMVLHPEQYDVNFWGSRASAGMLGDGANPIGERVVDLSGFFF